MLAGGRQFFFPYGSNISRSTVTVEFAPGPMSFLGDSADLPEIQPSFLGCFLQRQVITGLRHYNHDQKLSLLDH